MSYRIRCYTLFDITSTGVTSRKPPVNAELNEVKEWQINRNRQVNYDTILQVISLRSQPEDMSPTQTFEVNFKEFKKFGFLFDDEENQSGYMFDFTISHRNVFDNGVDELGLLYDDCSGVPMIKVGTEWDKLPNFLDSSPELGNICFEILSHD